MKPERRERVALLLYNMSPNMGLPWLERGWGVHSVDLQSGPDLEGWTHEQANMLEWVPPRDLVGRVGFVAAFPPCDDLAVSGARWFADKGLAGLRRAVALFERAQFWCEWFGVPYLIENPVSTISTYWRKPDFTFHPWHYAGLEPADCYTKKTCLWTGGGFVMPEFRPLSRQEPDDRIHKAPPGPDRANFRSATPLGFSRAVCEANT